jgi:hypothetical protein
MKKQQQHHKEAKHSALYRKMPILSAKEKAGRWF